jgi:hypothetical protein
MRIVGYAFMVAAFFFYVKTIQSIWTLVAESRILKPEMNFNRLWWLPAWNLHRNAYPGSCVRRRIVQRFAVTFALMLAGMGFIARSMLQNLPLSAIGR